MRLKILNISVYLLFPPKCLFLLSNTYKQTNRQIKFKIFRMLSIRLICISRVIINIVHCKFSK